MIASFADATTEDIFHGYDTKAARKVPKALWPVCRRKLDMINAATTLQDLRSPPSNQLEALVGDLRGKYSIRVNKQYRVVFAWSEGYASAVQITDYH